MNFNEITPGISLLGTTVKSLNVENSVVNILQDSERNFGLNINEPIFDQTDNEIFAMFSIELEIEPTVTAPSLSTSSTLSNSTVLPASTSLMW